MREGTSDDFYLPSLKLLLTVEAFEMNNGLSRRPAHGTKESVPGDVVLVSLVANYVKFWGKIDIIREMNTLYPNFENVTSEL